MQDLKFDDSIITEETEKLEITSLIYICHNEVFTKPLEKVIKVRITSPDSKRYYIALFYQKDIVIPLSCLLKIQEANPMKISEVEVVPKQSDDYVTIQITWTRGVVANPLKRKKQRTNDE